MFGEVLLVEDDKDIRELIVESLPDSGFSLNIYEAENPMQGLDLLHEYKDRISTVVCDFYLPIQNDDDLCEIIKNNHPKMNVFCLTGEASVKAGDRPIIDKVFYKPEGVKQVVREILIPR